MWNKIRKTMLCNIELWSVVLITGIFSVFITVFSSISVKEGILFFLFQIGGILIPGMAVVMSVSWKRLSKIEWTALSYAVGYGLNIVFYFLTVPFGLAEYVKYLVPAGAVIGSVIIWKNRKKIETYENDKKGCVIVSIFCILLLILELFTICAANFFPPRVEDNIVYHDMLYWIGNTITLKNGYPAVNFRDYPQPYTYHFFSSIQLAVVSLVTNLRPVILGFGFSIIQSALLMVPGAYALFKRVSAGRWAAIAGMAAVFFTSGNIKLSGIHYIAHVTATPFGYDIGMGFYTFLFLMLMMQMKEKFNIRFCILTVFFFGLTLGSKAPFGAVGLAAAGILCFTWLIGKQYKKAFGYGVPLLIVFALIYLFIVNLGSSDQPEASIMQTFINQPHIYNLSDYLRLLHGNFMDIAQNSTILRLVLQTAEFILALILSNYTIYIVFFYLLVMKLLYIRKWDGMDSACIAVVIAGTVVTMLWGNPDSSVTYFISTTYIPAVLFGIRTADALSRHTVFHHPVRRTIAAAGMVILLMAGIMEAFVQEDGYGYYLKKGWDKYYNKLTNNSQDRAYIDHNDYDAYEWIRCNTPETALVTANVGLQRGPEESSRHSRVPGVFMERYVITNEETDKLFYELDYGRIEGLRNTGVRYIIYNNTSTPGFELPEEMGSVVYSNPTNVIYELY